MGLIQVTIITTASINSSAIFVLFIMSKFFILKLFCKYTYFLAIKFVFTSLFVLSLQKINGFL